MAAASIAPSICSSVEVSTSRAVANICVATVFQIITGGAEALFQTLAGGNGARHDAARYPLQLRQAGKAEALGRPDNGRIAGAGFGGDLLGAAENQHVDRHLHHMLRHGEFRPAELCPVLFEMLSRAPMTIDRFRSSALP